MGWPPHRTVTLHGKYSRQKTYKIYVGIKINIQKSSLEKMCGVVIRKYCKKKTRTYSVLKVDVCKV